MTLKSVIAMLVLSMMLFFFEDPQVHAVERKCANEFANYRGANVLSRVTERDVHDFAEYGGNLLRVSFNDMPMLSKEKPYDINPEALARLDKILVWGEKYGVKIIIDPHAFPGTKEPTTTTYTDELWRSPEIQSAIVAFWKNIAERYALRGAVIAGYDLINEPSGKPGLPDDDTSWNKLLRRLVSVIREHDQVHYIIVEPVAGPDRLGKWVNRFDGLKYLDLPSDQKIVVSPHMYGPGQFTHQGVMGYKLGVRYPGFAGHKYWTKSDLQSMMSEALDFSKKHNVPIFIGEFSASRYAGADGDTYIKDLIDIFEENGWGWAYHAFREADVWDPEISGAEPNAGTRTPNAPRMKMLRLYFEKTHTDC